MSLFVKKNRQLVQVFANNTSCFKSGKAASSSQGRTRKYIKFKCIYRVLQKIRTNKVTEYVV